MPRARALSSASMRAAQLRHQADHHRQSQGILPLPQLELPAQHALAPSDVEQAFFFAGHGELPPVDARLLHHYAVQLAQAGSVAMWVLLYRPGVDGMSLLPTESRAVGAPVAAWGDGTLRRGLPLVAEAIRRDAGLRATPNVNHQRYFWFHCSLKLWELSFGHHYRPKYWWRVELDVLFAGSWAYLAERAASVTADLLLPSLVRHDTPSGRIYPRMPVQGARTAAVADLAPPRLLTPSGRGSGQTGSTTPRCSASRRRSSGSTAW